MSKAEGWMRRVELVAIVVVAIVLLIGYVLNVLRS
jgi:hypothetical protein